MSVLTAPSYSCQISSAHRLQNRGRPSDLLELKVHIAKVCPSFLEVYLPADTSVKTVLLSFTSAFSSRATAEHS